MKGFVHQTYMLAIEHLRMPAYLMASIGFPAIFFLTFALPEAKDAPSANFLLASFLGFAVMGVMFLQFAHGLAEERSHAWFYYLRSLPIRPTQFYLSRILVAWLVAILTMTTLITVAVIWTPAEMPARSWINLFLWLMGGGICFALMGVTLGSWVSERTALPLGNLIYLPLSYAGGLWKPPELLPQAVQDISWYLPTRPFGEILWRTVRGESPEWSSTAHLAGWSLAFLVVAVASLYWRGARRN